MFQSIVNLLLVPKEYQTFWFRLKITLLVFLLLSAVSLLLLALFAILQIPSFAIGNDTFGLLGWHYQPGTISAISFNPFLLLVAAVITSVRVLLKHKIRKRL
jgi:uncharacterized RDD family membrane protein YckC